MADVEPLRGKPKAALTSGHPAPTAAHLRAREAALGIKPEEPPGYLTLGDVPPVAPRDFVEWRREGVQDLVVSRLRRGHYDARDSLDLHGERVQRARRMVHVFLTQCHARGYRCVRIVHGRGEKAVTPGRLKSYVNAWLQVHPLVNAFVSATREAGGTGAVFVLLKKSRSESDLNRERHGGKADEE